MSPLRVCSIGNISAGAIPIFSFTWAYQQRSLKFSFLSANDMFMSWEKYWNNQLLSMLRNRPHNLKIINQNWHEICHTLQLLIVCFNRAVRPVGPVKLCYHFFSGIIHRSKHSGVTSDVLKMHKMVNKLFILVTQVQCYFVQEVIVPLKIMLKHALICASPAMHTI